MTRQEIAIRYLIDEVFASFERAGASCNLPDNGLVRLTFREGPWQVDALISPHHLMANAAKVGMVFGKQVRHAFDSAKRQTSA